MTVRLEVFVSRWFLMLPLEKRHMIDNQVGLCFHAAVFQLILLSRSEDDVDTEYQSELSRCSQQQISCLTITAPHWHTVHVNVDRTMAIL